MATPASNSNFDVEAYIGNYQGYTRLKRMAFIAGQNSTLKPDVLRAAIDEVRKTTNTALYLELIMMAVDTAGASARDDAWVEAEDKRASQRLEKLENDLGQHKTSLVKESIRVRARRPQRSDAVAHHSHPGAMNAAAALRRWGTTTSATSTLRAETSRWRSSATCARATTARRRSTSSPCASTSSASRSTWATFRTWPTTSPRPKAPTRAAPTPC